MATFTFCFYGLTRIGLLLIQPFSSSEYFADNLSGDLAPTVSSLLSQIAYYFITFNAFPIQLLIETVSQFVIFVNRSYNGFRDTNVRFIQ